MPLRKQIIKEASDIPSESQQMDGNTQEPEDVDDRDDKDEFSSSLLSGRHKRRREKENKSKHKEMTEEEMMDLALRLSEQEASDSALRLQQEEEAVMKAIEESMVGQTQPCPASQSQSLLADADASLRICPRRKLLYSKRKKTSTVDQGASEDACLPETDLNRETKGSGDEDNDRNKKGKRKEGSPLLEMPDLSQTQASPCSSESLSLRLDSPQSSDSAQIDDCQLRKSPVFPSTGCRAKVQVPRLRHDLLETCRSSGFVLCSQDSWTSTQMSLPAQPKSPTFPKSPKTSSNLTACPKSPVSSETGQGDGGETELSPEHLKSPVFDGTAQPQASSACRPPLTCENSGFMFSSQESLTPSVRSTSCRPQSPVFPRSPGLPKNPAPPETSIRKSPVLSETERGHSCSMSPVVDGTGPRQRTHLDLQRRSEDQIRDPQSLRQDNRTDHEPDGRFNNITSAPSVDLCSAPELNETSKDRNSSETELTADMTLRWSDEDEDVTPVGSPSPVFPEERPVHQAATLNHEAAASSGTNGSSGRCVSGRSLGSMKEHVSLGPSSSASTCRQQPPTTDVSRTSAPPGEPVDGPTVHYYWGVPFCPRGLDPDTYTQVILAQMQVYDRSLRQAQRGLLRKAPWGEPVLPQPEKSPSPEPVAESPEHHVSRRRGLRLRGNRQPEAADTCAAEAEEEEEQKDREEEEEGEKENKAEEEKDEGEEGRMDTDDCEVCPETQLSNDSTQDLTMVVDPAAELRPESPGPPEVEMILRDDSPAEAGPQEEDMEVDVEVEVDVDGDGDALVDGTMEGNVPVRSQKEELMEHREDPDVEEINDRGLQRSTSPELESAAVPQRPEANVDCPICQGSFPVTKIELHAAYCDGEVAVVDERRPEVDPLQVSLKPRRKRTRRGELIAGDTDDSSSADRNQEKCYICQKAVPLRDYSRHTELCIRRQPSKTEARGNLLSALQQTENRDSEAGPSGSRLQPGEVIDLRDDDDDEEEGGVQAFRISNSPIRSFTPISEATDCLIDFKRQQRGKKPSRRRR